MAETEITKIQAYLGMSYSTQRRFAQGWEIWYNDRLMALITDEAILRAYYPGKAYTHDAECLYHPDNEDRMDDYYNTWDRFPGDCDCPYEPTPPEGFSMIEMMLDRVKQRVHEIQIQQLRQVGRMCGSDPNV